MLSLAICEFSALVSSIRLFRPNFCFSNCTRQELSIFYPLVFCNTSLSKLEIAGMESLFLGWILAISGALVDRFVLLLS